MSSHKAVKLAEMQEKYTINSFCLVCNKGMQYPYGRHHKEGDPQSGTCSKTCETTYEGESHGSMPRVQ
jgi:hypothetical protein